MEQDKKENSNTQKGNASPKEPTGTDKKSGSDDGVFEQSEQKYRLLAENISVIWTIDLNLNFTYCSPETEYLLGYTSEEFIKMNLKQVLPPDFFSVATKVITDDLALDKSGVLPIGTVRTVEMPYIRKDGSLVWSETKASFLRDAEQHVKGVLGVTRDVSDRKKMEDELMREKEIIEAEVKERTRELDYERTKLSEIAEHMTAGAILLGKSGEVDFVNATAAQWFHLAETGKTIEVLEQAFPAIPMKENVSKVLSGDSIDAIEAEAIGKIFTVSFLSLKNEESIFGALIWINDITPQKLLEQAKSQFMEIASHEMRTPLAIIRGNAELLLREKLILESVTEKERIESILNGSVRLLDIVNDFLNVETIEGKKKASPKLVSVDLIQLLEETIADFSKMASDKNLSLHLIKPRVSLPLFTLDRSRLQQIFVNLISNAIHYTDHGGVTVAVENGNGTVRVLIEDTGIGIDAEDRGRIFNKFQTGKSFLTSKEYGSGLGLYISRLLANLMDMTVALEKSEVGKGSTFSLTIPLSKA